MVIELPPVEPGVNPTEKLLLVILDEDNDVGADGAVEARVTEVAFDALEFPAELMAFILILYVEPFVSPEIVKGLVVCAGLNAVNVDPPLIE